MQCIRAMQFFFAGGFYLSHQKPFSLFFSTSISSIRFSCLEKVARRCVEGHFAGIHRLANLPPTYVGGNGLKVELEKKEEAYAKQFGKFEAEEKKREEQRKGGWFGR